LPQDRCCRKHKRAQSDHNFWSHHEFLHLPAYGISRDTHARDWAQRLFLGEE
jgi:hypothetical protein